MRLVALVTWVTAGCAGGESDSVGDFNLTGLGGVEPSTSSGPDESTTGSNGDGGESQASETTADHDPATGPSSTSPTTGGGGLPCTMATDCDDGDPCTEDNCLNSACVNEPHDCDDGIECTMDGCDPQTGACTHSPDDTVCDDGDLCTGAETCSAATGCVAGTPVNCSDGEVCTSDVCNPATGTCEFDTIETCAAGDGCCPLGCSVADTDCSCTNLATGATPTSSGGGSNSTGFGPLNWVDGNGEDTCNASCSQCFGWITNGPTPDGAWMQLQWPSEQVIGSMAIDGIGPGGCQSTSRGLAGGVIEYWNGSSWIEADSFSGGSGDLAFSFDPPLQTTRLRIFDAVAPPDGSNSLAFEWYVFEPLGCTVP